MLSLRPHPASSRLTPEADQRAGFLFIPLIETSEQPLDSARHAQNGHGLQIMLQPSRE
jgi:hypothetical protein